LNDAVTLVARASVIRQRGLLPPQGPTQRASFHPAAGFAISVTGPGANA
jgi:hypothetical protein